MRWKHKSPIDRGARKCVREFLFLPKTLNRETRWLEWAEVQYSIQIEGRWLEYE